MPRLPPKLIRFVVSVSVEKELRADALITFDEAFTAVAEEFGDGYAWWWSVAQAAKSLPYRGIGAVLRFAELLVRFVS